MEEILANNLYVNFIFFLSRLKLIFISSMTLIAHRIGLPEDLRSLPLKVKVTTSTKKVFSVCKEEEGRERKWQQKVSFLAFFFLFFKMIDYTLFS